MCFIKMQILVLKISDEHLHDVAEPNVMRGPKGENSATLDICLVSWAMTNDAQDTHIQNKESKQTNIYDKS